MENAKAMIKNSFLFFLLLATACAPSGGAQNLQPTSPVVLSLPTAFTQKVTPAGLPELVSATPTLVILPGRATPSSVAALEPPLAAGTPVNSVPAGVLESLSNPVDGADLIPIPGGKFAMGSDPASDPLFWGAEAPVHQVSVAGFLIYRTEVTTAMYQKCVEKKACPKPEAKRSTSRGSYYENPEFENYPVILVSWVGATSYCQWAGGRLPSEAEWERAARGDGGLFPWGAGKLNGDMANFCDRNCASSLREENLNDGYADTAPVGSYPAGASPYGVLDMAGNVWEWVSDYFSSGYYQVSPSENPRGPASGDRRVIRGGSWYNPADGIRSVARASLTAETAKDTVGFRCAQDTH